MHYPLRRKALGQHELVDRDVLEVILKTAAVSGRDKVFEAGAGRGELTERLSKEAREVVAYELDRNLFRSLTDKFGRSSNVKIICENAFTSKEDFDIFVSNLPYSQSRRFVEWLVTKRFKRAIVTVQREFSAKLNALPPSKDYRSVSVLAHSRFELEVVALVDRKAFSPIPKVDSAILNIVPRDDRIVSKGAINALNKLFSFRRKRLDTALSNFSAEPLKDSMLGKERVDAVGPDVLFDIATTLVKRRS
ncbi:MAG: ribosomal RNA small subunit methyltransferase A [Nitrososphaerales archaeon]